MVPGDEKGAAVGSGPHNMGQNKTWRLWREKASSVCHVFTWLRQTASQETGATLDMVSAANR